jgi:hypothetical protein
MFDLLKEEIQDLQLEQKRNNDELIKLYDDKSKNI